MRIVWDRLSKSPMTLEAKCYYPHGVRTQTGLREEHLDPVQAWCDEHKCGTRLAFAMFRFKSEAEITAFLLVWG